MINKMSVKEFRENGYLQELNRQFLHPLGLALEINIVDGEEYISGIWDYRNDKIGIIYDLENSNRERIERFQKNAAFVEEQKQKISPNRIQLFGDIIEPIPNEKEKISS